VSVKNKDVIKNIVDKVDKFLKKEEAVTEINERVEEVKEKIIEKQTAIDVLKVGKEYKVVVLEYDLVTKTGKVLDVYDFDNVSAGMAFNLGRNGIESIVKRNKERTSVK
jgi:microcompartment protein CcmL/EutN